ncbi:Na+/H+ antiporter NhaC family protein [Gordonibacter sp. Marseille-P4307]|uniref:Na+/H+ antiporter NhaC family protein n=1 Tax=Gordonibacter sp. Marseille-P4307 TaxID=2161815 RepID=UPI001F14DAD9|nr:Na+/H+ antiporter NhaC family protein [Gordonibacter sp. Marseille-P4307]
MYSSLTIGVLSGLLIYTFSADGPGVSQAITAFTMLPQLMATQISSNAALILFLALLGALVVVIAIAGGSRAYAEFVATRVKNAKMAQLLSAVLGIIIFVFYMIITATEFGPMREAQLSMTGALKKASSMGIDGKSDDELAGRPEVPAVVTEEADIDCAAQAASEAYKGLNISDRGRVYDLVIPIVALIIFSIVGMLFVGGFFEGVDFATAVGEDPISGLCIGVVVALCVAAAMFLPRGLTTLPGFTEGISEGVRSMVGAIMILVLAWSLGGVCRYMIGTGEFVSSFLTSIGASLALLPAIIFLVAAFIAFAMGTSWGTVALILPIVLGVFPADNPLFLVAIGATLGGAVYGDHVSPISDTTILSSTGAQCNHLRHVSTQLPYATLVMVVCFIGYLMAGFTMSPWPSLVFGLALLAVAVPVLGKRSAAR